MLERKVGAKRYQKNKRVKGDAETYDGLTQEIEDLDGIGKKKKKKRLDQIWKI